MLPKTTFKLTFQLFIFFIFIGGIQILRSQEKSTVKIWEEELTLPAYLVDPPDKNPMFFNNRPYQGAKKVIYPYPLEDDITNVKITRTFRAVYLENQYMKVCVLPEIGGRLFYATDKTNDYEIFYRQHVIKPAHVGMLGAWISGGIEFCVFHHHRASTNMPIDYTIEKNKDGSVTLWIGETEPRHRMKWTFGISLYPGKSYIELDGRMINGTENTNSMLYWANVATSVNEDYQVIFPPSTDFATYHSKYSFAHWPITKETYVGNDYYKNNIDASWWKNHKTGSSFFAHDIKEGFLAGYDHGKKAGTMLVGNPHIVKGAKLWEWGKGSIWDTKVLTDTDGPYAELMSGAYSDNQPDYSWIKPYEMKTFKQYWYPMRDSQGATTANLNGFLNLKKEPNGELYIAANTTALFKNAKIVLKNAENIVFEKVITISPAQPFNETIKKITEEETALQLLLYSSENELLISYKPIKKKENLPLPEKVTWPQKPKDIASIEELYLTGLRIKQFHNALRDPTDYFLEVLKRDSLESNANTQMGIYLKENGEFEMAADHFRKAISRLTKNYTRPRNCEAFYHLGVVLKSQGKLDEAYETLYKAAWDHAFASAAYYNLALISSLKNNYTLALEELETALSTNASNLNALNLKVTLLRKKGKKEEATKLVHTILDLDKLNFWGYHELAVLTDSKEQWQKLKTLMRNMPESYLELAVGYLNAGFLEESKQILLMAISSKNTQLSEYPTLSYYLGYIAHQEGKTADAKAYFNKAKGYSTDYCFPYRLETINVYQTALEYDAADAKAYYYLGNLLYDKQPKKAIAYWEKSVKNANTMAIAYRNLGWGYSQTNGDIDSAIGAYEKAIAKDNSQPKYYYELDKLYEEKGAALEKRYGILSKNHDIVMQHNASLIRKINVLIPLGKYDEAITLLTTNYFNRKEGGNNLRDSYLDALLLRGKAYLSKEQWQLALDDFKAANEYPENQSIGKEESSNRQVQIFYFTGLTNEKMGNTKEALSLYKKATTIAARNPQYNYHKALSYKKLDQPNKAKKIITAMMGRGERALANSDEIDFFSKFGGRKPKNVRKANANYILGLGHLYEGNKQNAVKYFKESIKLDPGNAWAINMLAEANN